MFNRIPCELKKNIKFICISIILSLLLIFIINAFIFKTGPVSSFFIGTFGYWLIAYGWNLKLVVKIRRRFIKPKEFSIYVVDKAKHGNIELNQKICRQYFSLFKKVSINICESSLTHFVLRYQNKRWTVEAENFTYRCSPDDFMYIFKNTIEEKGNNFRWYHFVDVDKLTSKNIIDRMQFFKNNPNVFYRKGQLCFEDIFTGEYYRIKEDIFDKKSWLPMVQANKERKQKTI